MTTETDETAMIENAKSVNLSNSGLTILPSSLFKNLEITHLDISDNNLKNLPLEIISLKNLQYLNLCRNPFHCKKEEDSSVLPKGMENFLFLESLNISECNLSFIPTTIWQIISLRQLDISRNNVGVLMPDIGNLDNLIWLNAKHMGLTTLPQEIVGCEKLETLLLFGNVIHTLPHLLTNIPNLQHLDINLRHFAKNIDSNMDSLLQSGQILSDHISNTVFNLPTVKIIDLTSCKINYVKQNLSKALEELYLRENYFRNIPSSVLNLDKLRILDLSNNFLCDLNDEIAKLESLTQLFLQENQIETLSSKIFQMVSLDVLDLSHNKLQQINISSHYKNNTLRTLDISHNRISKLPKEIINLESLENFDITNNKLTEIPLELCLMKNIKTAHRFKGLYKIGLWLLSNPIEFPEKSVWSTTNIETIYRFLEKTKIQRLKKQTPIRVILLGDDNNDKISFLERFLGKTVSDQYITINQWTSSNGIPFVFVNVFCHPIYLLYLRYWLDDNCLIFLFIKSNKRLDQVRKWLELISDYSKITVVQLIIFNTEPDNVDSDSIDKERDVTNIDGKICSPSKDLQTNLISTLKTSNENTKILSEIIEISNSDNLIELKSKLEYIAIDESMFRDDYHFTVLNSETHTIEILCKHTPCIYIRKADLTIRIHETLQISDEDIEICLMKLHRMGKILWFRNDKILSETIYPFVNVFSKALQSLLRPTYEEALNFVKNPLIKAEGLMNENQFNVAKANFVKYGEISYPLYKILTFDMAKSSDVKDFLLNSFSAWIIPLSDLPVENNYEIPYLVLPQFNKQPFDKNYFIQDILLNKDITEVDCSFVIKGKDCCFSSEMFLNLRCAINCWAVSRFDWEEVVYLIHNDGDIFLMKEMSNNSQMSIDIIVRVWSNTQLDFLPSGGNFKKWLFNWFDHVLGNINNSSYTLEESSCHLLTQYICNHSKC